MLLLVCLNEKFFKFPFLYVRSHRANFKFIACRHSVAFLTLKHTRIGIFGQTIYFFWVLLLRERSWNSELILFLYLIEDCLI